MEKEKNIVVFGGSFAPATKAHIYLLLDACKQLNAKGILVPSSDEYVLRKLTRQKQTDAAIYASYRECRSAVLNALLWEYDLENRIHISHCELSANSRGRTLETLDFLAEKHKESQIHFLMGADKLKTFRKWKTADTLLSRYKVVVAPGRGADPVQEIRTWFPDKEERFIIQGNVTAMDDISSTNVRTLIKCKNYAGVTRFTCSHASSFLRDLFDPRED